MASPKDAAFASLTVRAASLSACLKSFLSSWLSGWRLQRLLADRAFAHALSASSFHHGFGSRLPPLGTQRSRAWRMSDCSPRNA